LEHLLPEFTVAAGVKDVKYVLVGVLVFNGTDHYMSAVQDTNRVWWFCNGTGVMRRQQNARSAFSTITKECPSQTLHPTHFFYAAVAN
jgi:hypothetical protein